MADGAAHGAAKTAAEAAAGVSGGRAVLAAGQRYYLVPQEDFVCPISHDELSKPVCASDGMTYDERSIEVWLKKGHNTSPMTGARLRHTGLMPNHLVTSLLSRAVEVGGVEAGASVGGKRPRVEGSGASGASDEALVAAAQSLATRKESSLARAQAATAEVESQLSAFVTATLDAVVLEPEYDLEEKQRRLDGLLVKAIKAGHDRVVRVLCSSQVPPGDAGPFLSLDRAIAFGARRLSSPISAYMSLPLHGAVRAGHIKVFDVLLELGADVGQKDTAGRSTLLIAAFSGHVGMVERVLQVLRDQGALGVAVNETDEKGWSALMYASSCRSSWGVPGMSSYAFPVFPSTERASLAGVGHCRVVQLLLDAGADVNWASPSTMTTALMIACDVGAPEVVGLLLTHGAEVDAKNCYGVTALMIACSESFAASAKKLKAAELLLGDPSTRRLSDVRGNKGQASVDEVDDAGETALLKASRWGFLMAVIELQRHGANAHVQANDRGTALIHASSRGHEEVVKFLLRRGPYVQVPSSPREGGIWAGGLPHLMSLHWKTQAQGLPGATALLAASKYGHAKVVHILLLTGAHVNETDDHGATALILASDRGHDAVVQVLKEFNARMDCGLSEGGQTALWCASQKGHRKTVELLTSGPCSHGEFTYPALNRPRNSFPWEKWHQTLANEAAEDGTTALMAAAKGGHGGVVEYLLDLWKKTDNEVLKTALSAQDQKGDTALLHATHRACLSSKSFAGFGFVIESILSHICSLEEGSDRPFADSVLNMQNAKGQTALMHAAETGVIHGLLRASEPEPEFFGIFVFSKLMGPFTMLLPEPSTEHYLATSFAKGVNLQNCAGETALMIASQGPPTWMETTEAGAAARPHRRRRRLGARLRADGGLVGAGGVACKKVQKLLSIGADGGINLQDNRGRTALMEASWNGLPKVVEALVGKGASIDLQTDIGFTALMWASHQGHQEVVEVLVGKGAGIDLQTKDGSTALMEASEDGHVDVVKVLLEKGAAIDLQDQFGCSALMKACGAPGDLPLRDEHLEVVKVLLEKGAAIDLQDHKGRTALMWASEKGKREMVEVLLEKGARK